MIRSETLGALRAPLVEELRKDVYQTLVGVFGDAVILDLDVDHVIGELLELPTLEADKSNRRDASLLSVVARLDNVRRVAARTDQEYGIRRLKVVNELLLEDLIVGNIVADRSDYRPATHPLRVSVF